MRKIAVIFPGVGYKFDRPLLYYAGKAAQEEGYEVIRVDFVNIDKECLRKAETMKEGFDEAVRQAELQLKDLDPASCHDIVFISKSIGTVVASCYAHMHHIPAGQIYLTPLEPTFRFVSEGNGIVFFGDDDPWIDTDTIRELCEAKGLRYSVIEGANHSLETGHVRRDMENMTRVIHECEDYLKDRSELHHLGS